LCIGLLKLTEKAGLFTNVVKFLVKIDGIFISGSLTEHNHAAPTGLFEDVHKARRGEMIVEKPNTHGQSPVGAA